MSRKSAVKLAIQVLIIILVVAGIARAVQKARRDLASQASKVDAQLEGLDARIERASSEADRRVLLLERSQVESQRLTFRNVRFGGLLIAGLVYLAALTPAWLYWHRILVAMGQSPTWFESFRAYYIGHLGKYMPGKALVVVLRTSLVCSPRTKAPPAALAVFVETLTTMAVGAFVAAVCLALTSQSPWLIWLSVVLMIGAGLPTAPPLFRLIIRFLRVKKLDQELAPYVDCVNGRLLLTGWLLGAVNWVGMGFCLYFVLRALPTQNLELAQLPLLTGAVALAAVAGFLSLLPGGIGVRELVVTEVLTPVYGAVLGVAGALVLRLCWLVCEVALSAILYGFTWTGRGNFNGKFSLGSESKADVDPHESPGH